LESAVEWPLSTTKRDKYNMGYRVDLPTKMKELKQRRLHTKGQPLEQLDEVIEEIRRLMLSSVAETTNNEKLKNKGLAIAVGQ
jgi:hypothetical protein